MKRALLVLLLAGCGPIGTEIADPDAGPLSDGGSRPDSGKTADDAGCQNCWDAGADSGSAFDAGGPPSDAGGAVDAGSDAGEGVGDSGAPSDAGGVLDSGIANDGGSDAGSGPCGGQDEACCADAGHWSCDPGLGCSFSTGINGGPNACVPCGYAALGGNGEPDGPCCSQTPGFPNGTVDGTCYDPGTYCAQNSAHLWVCY